MPMSLEVICDYKESLPSASGTDSPALLEEINEIKKSHSKISNKISEMEASIKALQKISNDILTIVKSLNKEITCLIEEPPKLDDDSS